MKILLLNHNLIGRGTWFRCLGFARELVKRGHSVDLWTVSNGVNLSGSTDLIDGVRVWQTPRWGTVGAHDGGYAPVDILCRMGAMLPGRWDVVHAFDHRPNVLFPWLVQRSLVRPSRTCFISDWCDWWTAGGITTARRPFAWIDRIEQYIEEGSKQMSDGVTVISHVLQQRARTIGIEHHRCLHLPAGVDVSHFPQRTPDQAQSALSLDRNARWLGFVGFSLWDMEMLARIFTEVLAQVPEARLLVIGGGVEEAAKRILREADPSEERIHMPGVLPFAEVPMHLAACEVLLLPMNNTRANQARIPNKLADYYASSRPVVASDVGDTGHWVHTHQSGLVASDETAFASAIVSLLQNRDHASLCGENGRRIAETDWSYATLTGQLEHFYQDCGNG